MKNFKKVLVLLVVVLGCSFILLGCKKGKKKEEMLTIIDSMGYEVSVSQDVKSVIALGPGAMRLMTYADAIDYVIGVETWEKKPGNRYRAPYNFVIADKVKSLPNVGEGKTGKYGAYAEKIIELNPDVIFCAYTKEALDKLRLKIKNIPIVSIMYSPSSENGYFDPRLFTALDNIGLILDREEKCAEISNLIRNYTDDLALRVKDVEKKSVYVGGVSYKGPHEFTYTYPKYTSLELIETNNLATTMKFKGAGFQIGFEDLVKAQPEYMFIDISNLNLIKEEVSKNREIFKQIESHNNIHTVISYNYYSTNIDLAILNAYYMGTILYPKQFKDIDIEEKAKEVMKNFVGNEDIYEGIKENAKYEYKKIDLLK